MKSLIRPVYYRDLTVFNEIWHEFILAETSQEDRFLHPLKFSGLDFLTGKLFKFLLGDPSFWDNFFIYEIDDKIAGFMEIFHSSGRKYQIFIRNFIISSLYRNRGYGKSFLKEIINKFSRTDRREFYLEVRRDNRAVNFYKRAGFVNIASKYYMGLTRGIEEINYEKLDCFRYWNPSEDYDKLNDLMESASCLPSINLIPYFPESNYIEHYLDNLLLKYKREKLDIYVLESDHSIQAYSVIYYYFKHKKAFLEIIFNPGLSHKLFENFFKMIIHNITSGIEILFSFTDMQKMAGDIFLDLGGKLYRENIIMRYINDI
jgi:ribosomal protein S18 acetylase RimI-like enzyme